MPLMLAHFLISTLPVAWAIIATLVFGRNLTSSSLFFFTALLVSFGLQAIITTAWDFVAASDGFLEAATTAEAISEQAQVKLYTAIKQGGLVCLSSFSFYWWLKSAFQVLK